jgi:hypothetical protein
LIVERDSLPASENPSSENKTATYVADTFGIAWKKVRVHRDQSAARTVTKASAATLPFTEKHHPYICSAGLLIALSWLLDTGKYASGGTVWD